MSDPLPSEMLDFGDASRPLIERIIRHVCFSLHQMTIGNGNEGTLSVDRPRPARPKPTETYNALVILMDDVLDEENPSTCGLVKRVAEIGVVIDINQDETAVIPVDTLLIQARAEVERRIMLTPRRDGLADDTKIQDPILEDADLTGSWGRVTVVAHVNYETKETDSFWVRGE